MALDLEGMAKEAAGNWRKFESFGWSDAPEDGEDWTIVHTANRDSSLIEQSNAAAFVKAFEKFDDETVRSQHFNHWACGWVDGYAVKVHNSDGTLTDAFKVLCELQAALESYPLLDDTDYSERENEAGVENITGILSTLGNREEGDELPEWSGNSSIAGEVLTWLFENEPSEAESRDDQGAYPSEAAVLRALQALDYYPPTDDD